MRKVIVTIGVVLVLLGCRKKHAVNFQGAKEQKCVSATLPLFQSKFDPARLTLTNWD